jgi:hypothetical protein
LEKSTPQNAQNLANSSVNRPNKAHAAKEKADHYQMDNDRLLFKRLKIV